MKISGTEGLDAQTIRDEVARGARFVIYTYCVSILVLTFKRPSSIHYVRPNYSRVARGWPFNLISLVFGWWGFPWGPIYTIQTLVNNLAGGIDVTDAVLADLPPLPGAVQSPAHGLPPPLPTAPVAARHPGTGKKVAIGLALIASLATIVVVGICFYRSRHLTVVLVSGAPAPYTFTLNGNAQTLAPGQVRTLELAEGDFTLAGGPGDKSPRTFLLARPFLDHLDGSRVAVINPDRAAIYYTETTAYYKNGVTPPADETSGIEVHANVLSALLPAPDYLFADFPANIDMPSETTRVTRTRLALLSATPPEARARLLNARRDYDTMRDHLEILALLAPGDEEPLRAAFLLLKPADARAFFVKHLADRPILVEWHRYYQSLMQRRFPDFDLVGQYRELAAAEPRNGALLYLLARVLDDPAESSGLYAQAIAAPQSSAHAAVALAYDYACAADYDRAFEHLRIAREAGLRNDSLRVTERATLLGRRDYPALLAAATEERTRKPGDLAAVEQEIAFSLLAGQGRAAAEKISAAYLARLNRDKGVPPGERASVAAYLAASIAYGLDDADGHVIEIAKVDAPFARFEAAIGRGDHAAAAAALLKDNPPEDISFSAWLTCYLVAQPAGATAAAENYFARALDAMLSDDTALRRLATRLKASPAPSLTPDEAAGLIVLPSQKRTLLAALALRDPANRTALLTLAARFNTDPGFPRLLITRLAGKPVP